jgi:hypothetical protein
MIMFCGLPVIVAVLPDVGGQRDRDQVWHRIALQRPRLRRIPFWVDAVEKVGDERSEGHVLEL